MFGGGIGMQELIVLGVIAVLLFGKRLPEVAKTLGSSYRQFRQGLADLQSQVNFSEMIDESGSGTSSSGDSSYDEFEDYDEPAAPKFEPPPAEPQPADNGPEAHPAERSADAQADPAQAPDPDRSIS